VGVCVRVCVRVSLYVSWSSIVLICLCVCVCVPWADSGGVPGSCVILHTRVRLCHIIYASAAVSYYISILHSCNSGESSHGALALFPPPPSFFGILFNPKYHTVFAQLCHITYASGESRDVMKTPKSSAAKTSLPGQLFVGRAGPGTPPMVYPKVCLRVSALCLRAVSVGVGGMRGLWGWGANA
jgi:hypothetical protein